MHKNEAVRSVGDLWHDGKRWVGVEPAAEIAGRVVVAGGRMRREEGRA
jgi:hypothetical protein